MSNTSNKASIEEFLSLMTGGKEIGLVIAKDEAELSDFAKAMDRSDFKRSENVSDLFKSPKAYLVAGDKIGKDVYDFIVQYPTGQVEIFNKTIMQSQNFSPDYKNSAIILLVEKDNLNKIQEKGFDLLGAAGPAFQS